ncbi:MAG: hypothetical protein HQK79_05530 [Desulfobacterales bacterium]|nr:hypothetical protein [Desulfobacterales bacterium]MBF0398256.1 hypothetical protein [Desulfobacterales bacterium]
MTTKYSKKYIEHLEERLKYLEGVNRFTQQALEMSASWGDFQVSVNTLDDQSIIINEARARLKLLIPFKENAFFLVNEEDSSFYIYNYEPDDSKKYFLNEVDILIEDGTFARAMREHRPIITYSIDYKEQLFLHVMTTKSRVRGMFIGVLAKPGKDVQEASLRLFTIAMLHIANTLESFELYNKIKQINKDLEKIVEDRTSELTYTNKQLNKEINERRKADEALNKAFEELKAAQVQLVQSAKLASIGQLAAGVAHELNQPLMIIRGNTQLAKRKFQKKDNPFIADITAQLEMIEKNTTRMMLIINHLRTFSRQSQSNFKPIDVHTIIDNCFFMMSEQLRLRSIEIQKKYEAKISKIHGDSNQLEQVFLNLFTNARDAMQAGGKLSILTKNDTDPNSCDQTFIEIFIKDTGEGINTSCINKIFDPFFTTKDPGKGTGLGLSISYGIIKEHLGEIEVFETSSYGTTFKIKFLGLA